jgi:hypothetical protein
MCCIVFKQLVRDVGDIMNCHLFYQGTHDPFKLTSSAGAVKKAEKVRALLVNL